MNWKNHPGKKYPWPQKLKPTHLIAITYRTSPASSPQEVTLQMIYKVILLSYTIQLLLDKGMLEHATIMYIDMN